MIPRHVSFHCLSSAFAHSLAMPFLFLSLSFCHFQFQSPSFLSPRSNPVDLSVSISIHSSLTLSIHHLFFLFTLFSYIYFPPSLIYRCANFYLYFTFYPFLSSYFNSFVIILFRTRFDKVGGHVFLVPISVTRG